MDGNRRDSYQDTLSFPTQQRKSFDLQVKKNVFNLVNVMSQRPGEASAAVPHPVTRVEARQRPKRPLEAAKLKHIYSQNPTESSNPLVVKAEEGCLCVGLRVIMISLGQTPVNPCLVSWHGPTCCNPMSHGMTAFPSQPALQLPSQVWVTSK